MRVVIPPLAFVGWAMLGRATAFDAVGGEVSETARQIVPLFLALVLAGMAKLLVKEADKKPPPAVQAAGGVDEPTRAAPAH